MFVLWVLLALFVVYPLAMLLARVLFDHGAFTTAGIATILTDRHQIRAFWNSLLLAHAGRPRRHGARLPVRVHRGARAAAALARSTAIDASVLLPLVSPPFTTAIAMIFSFGPRGLITYELLGLKGVTVYGLTSTLFSEVLTYFPIAYLTLRPILAGDRLEHRGHGALARRVALARVPHGDAAARASPGSPTRSCCCSPRRSPTSRRR